jgi:hypothetical protein
MNDMDDFIDTCIIISSFDAKDKYYETTNIFLEGSKDIIISYYQDKEEIPNLFLRRQKLFMEAIRFFKNPLYSIDYGGFTEREKMLLKTLLTKVHLKQENDESLNKMLEEVIALRRKVLHFIQKKVSKKVIPVTDIKEDLVNIIKRINQNKADAKIIASAIQEHQKNKLIAFTLDKNDWKLNSIRAKIENLGHDCPEVRFLR